MVTRRDVASIVGLGALGAVTASTLASPAVAQAADPNRSTFARIRRTKKMRIGAVGGGAPYYMKDLASGQWKGFYVDIAKALADDMEAELEITETTWGNSVLDLQSNKIDIFFGLNPTPKRALVVDFSVPVFNNAFGILCKKDFKPKSWAELNSPDVKIAVDQGSSHDQVVSRLTPKAQISRLKTADDATAALQTGRVDAQCLITMLSLTVLKKNPRSASSCCRRRSSPRRRMPASAARTTRPSATTSTPGSTSTRASASSATRSSPTWSWWA